MATAQPSRRTVNAPLVVLGAVLAVLGFASVLLLARSQAGASTGAAGSATVVVVNHDIAARTVIQKGDLTTDRQSSAPPGGVTAPADAAGRVALVDIKQGQPVLSNMLGKAGDVGATPVAFLPLPKGFVAMTIPATELQGVAGYIQAGDYIDVVAVVPRPGSTATVRTVYSSVRVIRVGPAPPDDTPGGTAAAQRHGGITTSLTIAVSQCQSEYLTWFINNATLRYTLLSYEDYQPTSSAPDTTCPAAGSAKGVTDGDIRSRWPGLL